MVQPYTKTTYYPGGNPYYAGTQTGGLISQFEAKEAEARAANLKRYEELLKIASEVETLFGPEYGAGYKTELERAKVRDVAGGMQSLISAGLGGTTRAAGLGKKWEEEVGAPARLRLEDIIKEKQFAAKQFKAGIIERREDVYPEYGALMQAVQAQAAVPSYTTGYGGYGQTAASLTSLPGRTGAAVTPSTYTRPEEPTTTPVSMAGGYGPAFQSPAELAKIAAGPKAVTTATMSYGQWLKQNPKGTAQQYLTYYKKAK